VGGREGGCWFGVEDVKLHLDHNMKVDLSLIETVALISLDMLVV
jgi:hypothetical protein